MQGISIRRSALASFLAGLLLSTGVMGGRHSLGAGATAAPRFIPTHASFGTLLVVPRQPRTLYLSLSLQSALFQQLPLRSTDGGNTWTQLSGTFTALFSDGEDPTAWSYTDPSQFSASSDGKYIYANMDRGGDTRRQSTILRSADGLNWGPKDISDAPVQWGPIISPASFNRLYGSNTDYGSPDTGDQCEVSVYTSADAGSAWQQVSDPTAVAGAGQYDAAIVPDPLKPETVYANLYDCDISAENPTGSVLVSNDAGKTWNKLSPPPGLKKFQVQLEAGINDLVASATPASKAHDRVFRSVDGGKTWKAGACAGDHNGVCPTLIVTGGFGAGQSYAFFKDGIYAFHGASPAGARIAASDTLPVPYGRIADVQAGSGPKDPIYLAVKGAAASAPAQTILYRSDDQGRTWHPLPSTGFLPNEATPSPAPGALLVPVTHHAVAAPFVATYHRLGPQILGYPVTEAYRDGMVLTQVFQHLELTLRGSQVIISDLGTEIVDQELVHGDLDRILAAGKRPVRAVPNSPTLLYFPKTKHRLQGDLLRYWQQHGGMATFGAPITEVITASNGDGSGRRYKMQYFEKARLEFHPENHDPRYTVLLGLLGNQALVDRGWLVTKS